MGATQTPENHRAFFSFEEWLDETTTTYRSGLLDVVEWNDNTSTPHEPMAFCHLESLIPFTDEHGLPVLHAYEGAMGVFLALKHLNTGDGSIIEEVAGLNEWCPIKFPTQHFFDTRYDARRTFAHVDRQTSLMDPKALEEDLLVNDPSLEEVSSNVRPSAFIGGFSSSVTAITAFLANLRNLPQVSGQSTSSDLDNRNDYPLFARTVPNEEYEARNALIWWLEELKLRYIAVIHTNDVHGQVYARSLRTYARELQEIKNVSVDIMYISLDEDGDNIPEALSALEASEYRYIFAVLSQRHLYDQLMEAAYNAGLAGNPNEEYNWFFGDSFRSVLPADDDRSFPKNSPLHLAYRGVGFIKPARTGLGLDDPSDKYKLLHEGLKEVLNSTEEMEYLSTVLPVDKDTGEVPFLGNRSFMVYDTVSFLYEATVLMGLSVCGRANKTLFVLGAEWYKGILETSFVGLTGSVILNRTTGTRMPNSTAYSILNFVDDESDTFFANGTEKVRFRTVLTHYHPAGDYDDRALNNDWIQFNNFTFNSGTSNLPPGIPDGPNHEMFISTGIQAFSLALYCILVLLVIGFAGWAWTYRQNRIVKSSQPFFLYLLCGGSFLFATTIVTLTFDHETVSIDGNTVACNSTVWLATLGLGVVFSALFAKTYRINRIMNSAQKFRRIKITVKQTLVPVAIVLLLNLIVLSVMTTQDPILYEIAVLARDGFGRPLASYGFCNYREAEGYLIALAVINIGTLLFALYQSWLARRLSSEFAESRYIGYALAGSLIASFIGIPVLILATESPDATAFVSSALVFLVVAMILFMLFVPKMMFQWKSLHHREQQTKVSGLFAPASSGAFSNAVTMSNGCDRAHGRLSFADRSDRESFGERILTTKTTEELVKEVGILRRTLIEAQKDIDDQSKTIARLQSILEEKGLQYGRVPGTEDAPRISEIALQIESTMQLLLDKLDERNDHSTDESRITNDEDKGAKLRDDDV